MRSGDSGAQTRIVKLGKKLRPIANWAMARYSKVGDPPVFDPGIFPWTGMLEANWPAIRQEAEALLRHRRALPPLRDISPDHRRIATEDWKSFFLWGYGYRAPENCRRCPETARIVERIPGLKSALFSILAPRGHIRRHKGVTKGMITCHLGVIVPKDRERCRIQVADHVLYWQEGRTMVFDDTYPHEVWNETDDERVVLLIQFARPLRLPGSLVSGAFLGAIRRSPFVRAARRNMAVWERRMNESAEA